MEQFVFHHVGLAVRDLPNAIRLYEELFGYKLVSGPFDDPIQKVSVCFLSRGQGDPLLELVAALGTNSPILGTLKKGGGPYHICYQVSNIRAAVEVLREKGSIALSEPAPAVAFEMREIAWVMTDADLLVELVQV
jgi:methylmalonyl-CoA/ethylmalonyl-CoA epimerase